MKTIHLFAPGPIGGAEKVVSSGVNELVRQACDTELWIIREARNPRWAEEFTKLLDAAVKTRFFESSGALDFSLIQKLRAALGEHQLLHTHAFKAAFYGHAVKSSTTKHVHTHHGQTAHTLKVRLYERIELYVMKRADQVHAVSTAMEKDLRAKGVRHLELVENPLVMQASKIRTPRPVGSSFLYVGRLSHEKGVDVLLKALQLTQKDFTCSLTIVGDGSERKNLEALAQSLDLKETTFLGFQTSVTDFFQQADALVMPSRREGLPLTLIEALCSGLPVIASRVGGIPDFVTSGKNGLLCEPDDPAALAQQLGAFLKDRERISLEARPHMERLTERFSLEAWTKRTLALYKSVLSHS